MLFLSKQAALEVLGDDSRKLAATAKEDLTIPIPSCPGWYMVDLLVHVGAVQRAQTSLITARSQEPMGIRREMFTPVPGLLEWLEASTLFGGTSDLQSTPRGLDLWFHEGAEDLVRALDAADPEDPMWSWSADQSVNHYLRLLPIETSIHRWDAQAAAGVPEPIKEDLALEAIAHTLEVMVPYRRDLAKAPPGNGESFKWIATGSDHTWRIAVLRE